MKDVIFSFFYTSAQEVVPTCAAAARSQAWHRYFGEIDEVRRWKLFLKTLRDVADRGE